MPSIAGAVIINWLSSYGGMEVQKILLLNFDKLESPNLILLFLYGNLFCYIASYPVLGFHVTRMVDFANNRWSMKIYDGYILTLILGLIIVVLNLSMSGVASSNLFYKCSPFALTMTFAAAQLYRIYKALTKKTFNGDEKSFIYAYCLRMARRRGIRSKELENIETSDEEIEDADPEGRASKRTNYIDQWRTEMIDTYRHTREHGNSAFIYILELILGGLIFVILKANSEEQPLYKIALVGVLSGLWALPAMFIHLTGQSLEREFSLFKSKID